MNNRSIKRLFWDIETSPNVVLSWRVGYDLNIAQDNIIKERAIICIGYKWEGDKQAHVIHWDKNQCDKAMLKKFLEVAAEADEMVAHNGDKFDIKWFKTRCIFHGLPFEPYKTVDTLKWARSQFLFNSNKMDYLARYLGLGAKIKTEFGLWKDICLHNSPKAMKLMTDYCKHDVVILEKVWKRLSELMAAKTHAGVLLGHEKWTCPHDGSRNVQTYHTLVSAKGAKSYKMKCMDCGHYFSITESVHSEYVAYKAEAKKK